MLDIKWIRENPEALTSALVNRGVTPDVAAEQVRHLIDLDDKRRLAIATAQQLQERRNALSREIGSAKAAKDDARAAQLLAEVSRLKGDVTKASEEVEARATRELTNALAFVPNIPLSEVPIGDERKNSKYRDWGTKPTFNLAKEHYELGEALGSMDFEAAAKLSGSRFVVLKGQLARMERALGQFMLDLHTQPENDGLFGYTEVRPPLLVRDEILYGTAQLPKSAEDMFKVNLQGDDVIDQARLNLATLAGGDDFSQQDFLRELDRVKAQYVPSRLWLIPTAEVPLTNLVRESILEEKELPLRFTALTPCFRSEAGAAGRDTRGMLRQHQFDKVELVSITTPEASRDEHERMLACAEEALRRLDLHYRVMTLSTGDMGFGAQKTYDIEVWLPGQGTYREISSCSVCGDFQARRMQARYRQKDAKNPRLVHTLNGSGVAVGRALIAVMENYQNADGSITVPDALKPYMGGVEKIG